MKDIAPILVLLCVFAAIIAGIAQGNQDKELIELQKENQRLKIEMQKGKI